MSNIDLMPFIQAVIGLLAAVIVRYVIPWIKAKTTAEQRAFIISMVKIAVQAAEQLANLKTGEDKKNYVLRFLKSKGLTVEANELEAMIEAAVYEINNSLLLSDEIIVEDEVEIND